MNIIDLSEIIEKQKRDEQRHQMLAEFERLLWEDLDALCQLSDYCQNLLEEIDERAQKTLIERGILTPDGDLPRATSEAMYQLLTGYDSF